MKKWMHKCAGLLAAVMMTSTVLAEEIAGLELQIVGPQQVLGEVEVPYKCIRFLPDLSTMDVTNLVTWSIEPKGIATMLEPGLISIPAVNKHQEFTLSVSAEWALPDAMVVSVEPVVARFVDSSAQGIGDGSNWSNAFASIQDALDAVTFGIELRLAQGVYRPDVGQSVTSGDRDASFHLKNGVLLRGGYAGLAGPDPDARDIERFPTILCGDIGQAGAQADNTFNVVKGSAEVSNVTLVEGVTIRRGHGDSLEGFRNRGAGMQLLNASPRIRSCRFSENVALAFDKKHWVYHGDGGGLYTAGGKPSIEECTFIDNQSQNGGGLRGGGPTVGKMKVIGCDFTTNESEGGGGGASLTGGFYLFDCTLIDNSAWNDGGGLVVSGSNSNQSSVFGCVFHGNDSMNGSGGGAGNVTGSPHYRDCLFLANSASIGRGGGFSAYVSSSVTATNCAFIANQAYYDGGGVYMVSISLAFPTFVNCMVVGNVAQRDGGGMHILGDVRPTVVGCTIANNEAGASDSFPGIGGGIRVEPKANGTPKLFLQNSIVWGNLDSQGAGELAQVNSTVNSSLINASCIQGWSGFFPGEGNIGSDPQFLSPSGADGLIGTVDDNFRLAAKSPCVDAGSNTYVTEENVTDLDGHSRMIDGNDDGEAVVDIGAYEKQPLGIPGDITGDDLVNVDDLLAVINAWGKCNPGPCPADIAPADGGNGVVNVDDLLVVINNWG